MIDIVLYTGVMCIILKWAVEMTKLNKMDKAQREEYFDKIMMQTILTALCFVITVGFVFALVMFVEVIK